MSQIAAVQFAGNGEASISVIVVVRSAGIAAAITPVIVAAGAADTGVEIMLRTVNANNVSSRDEYGQKVMR
jgi:hypothetical protein